LNRIARQGARMTARSLANTPANMTFFLTDPLGLRKATLACTAGVLTNPVNMMSAQMSFYSKQLGLTKYLTKRMFGLGAEPVAAPDRGDRRFADDAWIKNPVHDVMKQSYLNASEYVGSVFDGLDGIDERSKKTVEFFVKQGVEALSPSNFLVTNPVVLRKTVKDRGKNLLRGLEQLADDMERSDDMLNVAMTDLNAFEVGRNLAITPGKVIFQNDLFQLIQYEPATEKVAKRPLLYVPAAMNKYYIADLQPKNSLFKWLVDQGQTVFAISWVNPDERHTNRTYDDYVVEGIIAASDAVMEATGEKTMNIAGYCYGGILVGSTLGYLAAIGDKRFSSASFFTTMLDFTDVGDISVFVNESGYPHLKKQMLKRGVLEGSKLGTMFRMLRPNELLWPNVIQSYLMGERPVPFDILYWNSDVTNMPATMHTWFIKAAYIDNRLKEPGGTSIAGVPVDLGKVKTPAYIVATRNDHVAPWKTCYTVTQLLGGPVTFALAKSGHIAGVINHPSRNKYGYWINDEIRGDADRWLREATLHEGSWWPNWVEWLGKYGGKQVPARIPENAIEDAPGSYVKVRLDAS
jgi:polyhydroxyalkanoate synthase